MSGFFLLQSLIITGGEVSQSEAISFSLLETREETRHWIMNPASSVHAAKMNSPFSFNAVQGRVASAYIFP